MKEAAKFQEQEKYDEARIKLQSAIDVKPKSAEAYYQLAETLIRLQKLRNAIENYNTALNYDPTHLDARLHLASILLAATQYEFAENHINKVLDVYPENPDALVLKANLLSGGPQKNNQEAKETLAKVLENHPSNVAALASLANVELKEGNSAAAEELFSRALAAEPENAPLQMALADLYARQGRLEESQQVLEKLVKENPKESGLRYIFGEFLLRRGLADRALEQYEETIKADPERHDARDRLYDMYLLRSMTNKANALAAELETAQPESPGIHYFKGRNAQAEGKKEEALQHYLESIKLLNNFAPAFSRAGLLELEKGEVRVALEHLNQAVAIDPADVAARLALAKQLFRNRELSQATEHLDQVLSRYPRQLGANVLRADVALVEGDLGRARSVYDFLIETFPNNPVGYFKLGLLEEKAGNPEKAAELYLKTISFDQNVLAASQRLLAVRAKQQKKPIPAVLAELARLKENSAGSKPEFDLLIGSVTLADTADNNRVEKAKKLFMQAVEGNPALIAAYFALGQLDAAEGNLEAAIQNYRKLLEKTPKHLPTLMLLAQALEHQQKYSDAVEIYNQILEISPRFAPAANNLAWLLAEEIPGGDLDQALALAQIAKEGLPEEASVADTLGWIHFKRKSPRAALPYIQEAVSSSEAKNPDRPVNPEILFHLAQVQFELDDKKAAKETMEMALSTISEKHPKYEKLKEFNATLAKAAKRK
jgi:tetratricopeptide (TPR) repeat protein